MAAYGLVIHDPTGALAERKQAFASACYTEDMRRWRIAGGLWNIWQFGEYNGISRLARRGDGVGLLVAQGRFVEWVMRLDLEGSSSHRESRADGPDLRRGARGGAC